MMAIENEPGHVSDVMADALSHLNRVVEHVRAFPGIGLAGLIKT
jgi:hypothetical protein